MPEVQQLEPEIGQSKPEKKKKEKKLKKKESAEASEEAEAEEVDENGGTYGAVLEILRSNWLLPFLAVLSSSSYLSIFAV